MLRHKVLRRAGRDCQTSAPPLALFTEVPRRRGFLRSSHPAQPWPGTPERIGAMGLAREQLLWQILGGSLGKFKRSPIWGCPAPRNVVALGATAPHRSVGKEVQGMHLLQIEHRISVEQAAQTVMEKYL
jgi:hypothetical protein